MLTVRASVTSTDACNRVLDASVWRTDVRQDCLIRRPLKVKIGVLLDHSAKRQHTGGAHRGRGAKDSSGALARRVEKNQDGKLDWMHLL